jgi:mitochondrial-processing peptidase subunit alpha
MLQALETLGGNIQCASSRESLMYQAATFNSAVPTTVGLLAETVRDPRITEEEVLEQLRTAEYEIGEIWSKPELILPELVHMAAYRDNTLGNPLLCPQERLDEINKGVVEAYRAAFYKPERIVLAFAGVNHQEAVVLAERYFGDMKSPDSTLISALGANLANKPSTLPSSPEYSAPKEKSRLLDGLSFFKDKSSNPTETDTVQPLDPSRLQDPSSIEYNRPSHYTGGFLRLPAIPPPPSPMLPRLSYVHLAFEALPINSDDIYALATLQTLLGGGGSFSAGGPGKGMYSRLYTNVLNQHGWVESCIAFNHGYTDSGLFGISAACLPTHTGYMIDVMCRELQALTLDSGYSSLQEAEVQRAKNQLKSQLLMNLESRMVELEDLGRQVQVHGRKIGVKEMSRKIDELTIDDLRRVAKMVFGGTVRNPGGGSGAPTVVLQEGDVENVKRKDMSWDEIQDRIARWKLGRR